MRFLKWFVGFGLIVIGCIAVGYIILVEVTAWWGARELLQEVVRIRRLARDPIEDHGQLCQKEAMTGRKKSDDTYYNLAGYQLRFISRTKYVTELVCGTDVPTFLKLTDGDLKAGVVKYAGSGVFYPRNVDQSKMSQLDGGVKLKKLYRKIFVGLIQAKPKMSYFAVESIPAGVMAPPTTCEGYSGSCCVASLQKGTGFSEKAIDCPNDCFERCLQVPKVTQLIVENTAYSDGASVEIVAGKTIEVVYEATDVDGVINSLTLDFGDGETAVIPLDPKAADIEERPRPIVAGAIEHVYQCAKRQCEFVVGLKVVDNDGMVNAADGSERLDLIVNGGN